MTNGLRVVGRGSETRNSVASCNKAHMKSGHLTQFTTQVPAAEKRALPTQWLAVTAVNVSTQLLVYLCLVLCHLPSACRFQFNESFSTPSSTLVMRRLRPHSPLSNQALNIKLQVVMSWSVGTMLWGRVTLGRWKQAFWKNLVMEAVRSSKGSVTTTKTTQDSLKSFSLALILSDDAANGSDCTVLKDSKMGE
jgi:hypothetical protein